MPTYMVDSQAEISLSVRPLSITLRIEGGGVAARLEARDDSGAIANVVSPRADLMIVPKVESRISVRVLPIGVERFPASTIAHLSVLVDNPGAVDPERAVLVPVELSGLDSSDLLLIERVASTLRVRRPRAVKARVALEPRADLARMVTTEILGVQAVDEAVALNVVFAVDTSASMTCLRTSGAVDAVIDILVGVAAVVSGDRDLAVALLGSEVVRIPVAGVDSVSATLTALANRSDPGSGLLSGNPALFGLSPVANTVTYLVTDAVPADVGDLETMSDIDGEAPHLIVVGSRSSWSLQKKPSVACTQIFLPETGQEPVDAFADDPHEIRRIVVSLLAGCFPVGTPAFAKVNQ